MRPRRFATGQADLKQACADLKRAYRDTPEPASGFDGFARLLMILGVIWAVGSAGSWGWHWMIAHSLSRPELVQNVPAPRAQPAHPEWQIGQSGPVTLDNGQKATVTYMGEIPAGTVPHDLVGGQMWKYQGGYWVWIIPTGGTQPAWVDP